jgi:hypothetical protein
MDAEGTEPVVGCWMQVTTHPWKAGQLIHTKVYPNGTTMYLLEYHDVREANPVQHFCLFHADICRVVPSLQWVHDDVLGDYMIQELGR